MRPNGPGGKWLAFEDGDGNKIFSYTRHELKRFEGREIGSGSDRQQRTAYLAIYIRTDLVSEYLPGKFETFKVSRHLHDSVRKLCTDQKDVLTIEDDIDSTRDEVALKIYDSRSIENMPGLLNCQSMQLGHKAALCLTVPEFTTFFEIRQKVARWSDIEDKTRINFYMMRAAHNGRIDNAQIFRCTYDREVDSASQGVRPIQLWMHILDEGQETKDIGTPDPKMNGDPFYEQRTPETSSSGSNETTIQAEMVAVRDESDTSMPDETVATENGDNHAATIATLAPAADLNITTLGTTAGDLTEPYTITSSMHINRITESFGGSTTEEQAATRDLAAQNVSASISEGQNVMNQTAQSSGPDHTIRVNANITAALTDWTPDTATGVAGGINIPAIADVASNSIVEAIASGLSVEDEAAIAEAIAMDLDTSHLPTTASTTNLPGTGLGSVTNLARQSGVSRLMDDDPNVTFDFGDAPRRGRLNRDDVSISSTESDAPRRPFPYTYGFVQLFDAHKQQFITKKSFIAKSTSSPDQIVRKALGCDEDEEICIWRFIRYWQLAKISDAFKPIDEIEEKWDGMVFVASKPLSDDDKTTIAARGDFTDPQPLARYLLLSTRNSPTTVTTESVSLAHFGQPQYTGPLMKGVPHGPHGALITNSGDSYNGPFCAGSFAGPVGHLTYQNGDVYSGPFQHNERHGPNGSLTEKRTGNRYVGGFKNGKKWGKGITYWEVADEEREMCQICYAREIDALFYDCGHVVACMECAGLCEDCPICRKSVVRAVRMFRS